jgi:hypothetical protein
MKVVVGFATADAAVRTFLFARRGQAIPPGSVAQGYFCDRNARFVIQTYPLETATDAGDLQSWLEGLAAGCDGLILLIDHAARHLTADVEDAYFVASLPAYPGRFLQNRIHAMLAPVLRHYAAYCRLFDHFRTQKMLLLPFEVFHAAELAALRKRLTSDKMLPGLAQELEHLLQMLGARERPKRHRRFRKVYLVDDRPLWYRYGPERHKLVETAAPPHAAKCWHNSRFRFGRLYDDRLHHNVDDGSDPTHVHGQFTDCHGDPFVATGESHLGIFPNGFQ